MTRTVLWTDITPPLGRSVVAMGVFDGVHIGHQALIADTIAIARARDAASVVLTFDRDPDQIVTPAGAAPQLLDLEDKLDALAALGPDFVLVIPFESHLAAMPPLVFLDAVLLKAVEPIAVVVGYDFRFGHRAEGDVDVLVRYGADHDFTVVAHDLIHADGSIVTSTRIRELVASGDVAEAARLLGKPHTVRGMVVHGRAEGIVLGVPTANLSVDTYAALPAHGVYAGTCELDGVHYPAGISVGHAPSFPEAAADLEAHLIGFEGDLYDRSLAIGFIERIRDQKVFSDPRDLAAAIAEDLHEVDRIVGRD